MATTCGQTSSRLWSRESRVGNLLLRLVELAQGGRDRCLGHGRVQEHGRRLGVEGGRQEPVQEGVPLVGGQLIGGGQGGVDREDDGQDAGSAGSCPNSATSSHTPKPTRAAVAARLNSDRQQRAEGQPQRDVQDRDRDPDDQAQHLRPGRDDAQPQQPEAGDHQRRPTRGRSRSSPARRRTCR